MLKGDLYTTEKKEELSILVAGNKVTNGYRIWAVSKGGTRFHLDIPEEQIDKAEALLSARAKAIDAI